MDDQMEQQDLSDSQDQSQGTQDSSSPTSVEPGEQTLDERLDLEAEQIKEIDEANKETADPPTNEGEETEEVGTEGEDDPEDEHAEDGKYKPNTKYKVLDEEHEFDPKLKSLLTKETEPLIRELYEKAHGIEAIKASRDRVTQERDQLRGNHQGLVEEVGRILNYKRAGDLESFFEACELDLNKVAEFLLKKAEIAKLPPEQQAMYNEREILRRRLNAVEEGFKGYQQTTTNTAVQDRIAQLDTHLSGPAKSYAESFDARNGKGAFKQAVMEHAAAKWHSTKKDLTVPEAVESFVKMTGLTAPKGQPKPGPDATKRVVSKPKVKTLPNYGGGPASVTAVQKPKSIDEIRKISREKYGS